ncbi:thioredoxin [Sphingosinicella soli]|uniref:Thioredoxin n=1 Tax=Sphingosinicella soli TaxID=333708 RepID=A0A7W7B196_9SPHN|nr:thioredoxin [Sphingosinicella soli]MBB4632201.1 thioredoxin 1 [Sphingosinicella soli]
MGSTAITPENFEAEVANAGKPVLVDFWAPWCGPCRQIAPALEELSEELGDQVTIAKLNTDDHPELASQFGIRGIPTMILFKDGKPAATKVGAQPKSSIKDWLVGELA